MKKIYIALAVVATAMLISCEREKSFNEMPPLGENEMAFTLQGVSTRSAELLSAVTEGVSIPVGVTDSGEELFLDETIEELNPMPATKGAPAYTVNVGSIYKDMSVYADGGSFGDNEVTFSVMDQYINKDASLGTGWRYQGSYTSNPWPSNVKEDVDFYLRMPASQTNVTISDDSYADGTISFGFESPRTGEEQQDILFSFTSLSKEDHDGYLPNGAPVLMYHALTGVKFRSGHPNTNSTNTIITGVKINGLKNIGSCVFDIDATDKKFDWTVSNSSVSFSQTFSNPDYTYTKDEDGNVTVTSGDGTVGYVSGDNNTFGDSWYQSGTDSNNPSNLNNLNDEDGSLTFWFIPQTIDKNVTIEVTFCVKTPDTSTSTGGGVITHTIKFGDILTSGGTKTVEWKAGQLRTYTLKPSDVDVEIFDTMEGLEKDDLHVTNTGNVDEYVRMMLIGNWYDSDGNILVGYKYPTGTTTFDEGEDINTMVDPWFRENPNHGQYFDEATFKNGFPNGDNPWIFGTGSYFYYPEVIGPGDKLSGTQSLFQSYILPQSAIPTIWLETAGSATRTQAQGVHLVMEVVVQAISTVDPRSTTGEKFKDWKDAWSYVTGQDITEKENPNKPSSDSGSDSGSGSGSGSGS